MEWLRRRLEAQVLSLSGLALGQLDYSRPAGDPGLFGPDSVAWRVNGDFTSMMVGGIAALLLQALHPLALAGVWDHSNFREDLIGRLRRTGQFVAGTTFAPREQAEWLIARVREIHLKVVGQAPDGRPYAASDPALLTWVHVCEASCFLASHYRYARRPVTAADGDRYYAEMAQIAERLGAHEVPVSQAQVEHYLQQARGELRCDERSREILRILLAAPAPSAMAVPVRWLLMEAGIDLLPDWARELFGLQRGPLRRQLVRTGIRLLAPLLRWAVRRSARQLSCQRVGRPAD